MKLLNDNAIGRLRVAAEQPDLSGTRYKLIGPLGQGGMGSVYRVEDSQLGRQVALKVISLPGDDCQLADRLVHEAKVLAQLEHPGIVPVHDVGTLADGRVFYTMKLVQGQRLDQYLPVVSSLNERLRIFQRICEPVAFAHARGVLHRDLKPQNIMIGPFGEVLVMDWGLSKWLADHTQPLGKLATGTKTGLDTMHGAVLGTPGYMSPEQARGEVVDRRTDVYSLGAILKFIVPPTDRQIPGAVRAIANKCLEREPERRYSSAEHLTQDISNYLDGLRVSAYPESWLERVQRWATKNQAWLWLIAAYLVMRTLFILWKTR
jgi:serine/threonine protein kinase